MATTTPARDSQHTVALDLIHVPDNVRDLDPEHVKALAGSIALQGVLVPIVVRPDGESSSSPGQGRLQTARAPLRSATQPSTRSRSGT
jgi:ParB-like nuclease domain